SEYQRKEKNWRMRISYFQNYRKSETEEALKENIKIKIYRNSFTKAGSRQK
ncbi:10617_t:CDS:1, partial [Gigaspora margarita]